MPMNGYMSHTQAYFFTGVLAAVISWTSSASSMFPCNYDDFFCRLVAHQNLTWAHIDFNCLLRMLFHIVNSLISCFLFLSLFSYFSYPSSWISLHPQQQCILFHFQPYLWHCIHDRFIHMLHKCDCLLVFFFFFSKHFATIISPDLSVLILDKFIKTICHCKCFTTCHTPRLFLFLSTQLHLHNNFTRALCAQSG